MAADRGRFRSNIHVRDPVADTRRTDRYRNRGRASYVSSANGAVALAVGSGYRLLANLFGKASAASPRQLPWPLPTKVALGIGAAVAIVMAGVSMHRLDVYADTVMIWQDAIVHYPASNVINANLASELLAADRPDEALAVARQARERGCNSRGIYNNLGAALTALGDRDGYRPGQREEAIEQFQEALRISPDFEDALVNLSFSQLKGGQANAALASCSRALEINARNPQALYAQGTILMAPGAGGEAAESFRRALEQDPASAVAHYGFALVLLAAQHADEAIGELETASRLDPRLPEVHYALAGAGAAARFARRSASIRRPSTCDRFTLRRSIISASCR